MKDRAALRRRLVVLFRLRIRLVFRPDVSEEIVAFHQVQITDPVRLFVTRLLVETFYQGPDILLLVVRIQVPAQHMKVDLAHFVW